MTHMLFGALLKHMQNAFRMSIDLENILTINYVIYIEFVTKMNSIAIKYVLYTLTIILRKCKCQWI